MDTQLVQMLVCGLIMALAFNEAYASQESPNLQLTMTPATIIRGLTKEVHLRCDVKESFEGSVETLKVTWRNNDEEKTVAKVTSQAPVATDMTDGDLTAEGSAQGRPFLDLTWSQPALMKTSGTYVCQLIATRTGSDHHHEEVNIKLPTRGPSLADLIAFFKDELSTQNKVINRLETENNEQKALNTQQVMVNQAQKEVNLRQRQVNNRITACQSDRVAFTARHQAGIRKDYRSNEVVKYTDVEENINGNFDVETSVFTCSVPGIYQFDLHVMGTGVYGVNKAGLGLVLNGRRRLTEAFTQVPQYLYATASASVVVKLAQGDTVMVKANPYESITIQEDAGRGNAKGNTFSGSLVSSDKCLQ